jgi:hypothetical protein
MLVSKKRVHRCDSSDLTDASLFIIISIVEVRKAFRVFYAKFFVDPIRVRANCNGIA